MNCRKICNIRCNLNHINNRNIMRGHSTQLSEKSSSIFHCLWTELKINCNMQYNSNKKHIKLHYYYSWWFMTVVDDTSKLKVYFADTFGIKTLLRFVSGVKTGFRDNMFACLWWNLELYRGKREYTVQSRRRFSIQTSVLISNSGS